MLNVIRFTAFMAKRCFIRCLESRHPDILLPDAKEVILGRGPETRIKEKRCSRQQVSLKSNYLLYEVNVQQVGRNGSSMNGTEIGFEQSVQATDGDVLELLSGEYKYRVIFDPKPPKRPSDSPPPAKVRKESPVADKLMAGSSDEATKVPSLSLLNFSLKKMKETTKYLWEQVRDDHVYVMTTDGCHSSEKIAAFDMDGTLITTQSGRVFPKDNNDWKILFPEIPSKLKKLTESGFKIVVLTNQAGIAKGKVKLEDFQSKVERIADRLGVQMQLFCCAADGGFYRKPRIAVWKLLESKTNQGQIINIAESFYCGDAAGRLKDWQPGKKKDFSCSDRLFAMNLGLKFLTPEEFFLGQKPTSKYQLPEFDPKSVSINTPLLEPQSSNLASDWQEVILMVGIQGSGKSHFAEETLGSLGYVIASNDKTGSRAKTIQLLERSLGQGKSVVVDNTHAEKETREKFVAVAKKHKVSCRCFIMKTTPQHARHNNIFRELIGTDHTKIKEPLFNAFASRYQEPTLDEGFSEIVKVNFVPKFKDSEEEALYRSYLQEK